MRSEGKCVICKAYKTEKEEDTSNHRVVSASRFRNM